MNRQHLTVYGATGFTAKIILAELLQGRSTRWPPAFKWSIAGRNRTALERLRAELQQGITTTIPLPNIIVADVRDQETLNNMARQTYLLLNCVGPYREYGEPVVKACIEAHTDYLDLCGEPAFIEKMHLRYHDLATQAGITMCHAAAFDSVPCDLGVNLCKKVLAEKDAYPSSVEMSVKLTTTTKFAINYATYESAIKGFAAVKELRESRKELARVRPKPVPVGPPLNVQVGGANSGILGRIGISRDTRTGGWLIPYFFSDPAVVRLSQSLTLYMTKVSGAPPAELAPVHFAAHIQIPTIWSLVLFVMHFMVFQLLVVQAWGRKLLYGYPGLFTWGLVQKGDIEVQDLSGTTFSQTFYARGYSQSLHPTPANVPDVDLTLRISGPEPGYKCTSIIFLEAASLVLSRRDVIKRGVLTPAVAFGDLDHTGHNDVAAAGGILDALQKDGRITWSIAQMVVTGSTLLGKVTLTAGHDQSGKMVKLYLERD